MTNAKNIFIFYPSNTGGVAEVCLSIKSGIEKLGYNVICITSYSNALKVSLTNVFSKNKNYAITNLHYGFFGLFFKRSAFVVHGFPQREHLSFKNYKLVVFFHWLFSKLNTRTVAVSYLTKFVSENFYNIKVHQVIHNILPHDFFSAFNNSLSIAKKPNSIAFVGRVINEKGVEKILQAVNLVRQQTQQNVFVHIVGSGLQLNYLQENYKNENNYFYGYVDARTKYKILAECNTFISLHPAEPFGITALEASVLNVKCCLSAVGGHTEFVPHNLFYPINDTCSVQEIATAIFNSFNDKNNYHQANFSLNNEDEYQKQYAQKFIQILENN